MDVLILALLLPITLPIKIVFWFVEIIIIFFIKVYNWVYEPSLMDE